MERGTLFWKVLPALILFITGVTNAATTAAPKLEPIPVEATLDMKYFSQYSPVSFSADGEWLAYTVRENTRNVDILPERFESTGIPHYGSGADIYVLNLKTHVSRNLTLKDDNWLPTWSPQGCLLAFLSDRDGSGQARLWIWDARQNQMWEASERNIRGAEIEWLPDSSGIVVAVARATPDTEQQEKELPRTESSQGHSRPVDSDASVTLYRANTASQEPSGYQSDGPWNLDRYRADLVLVDLRSGGDSKVVAEGGRVATFYLSPDGTQVAYAIPKNFELPGSQQILFDLRVVDLEMKQRRTLASDIRLNPWGSGFRWSPDGLWISYVAAGMEEKRGDYFAIEVASGKLQKLTDFAASSFSQWGSPPLWNGTAHIFFLRDSELWEAAIGQHQAMRVTATDRVLIKQLLTQTRDAVWIANDGKSTIVLAHDPVTEHDGFYGVDLKTGAVVPLAESGGCYTCVVRPSSVWTSPDRQTFAFLKESATTPDDLWISAANMTEPQRVTTLNPQLGDYIMGKTRLVEWLSDDGEKLKGTLLLPAGYKDGSRYPLVVWVYGGDSGADHLDIFGVESSGPINLQLLATRGYAVLMPGAPETAGSLMFDTAKTVLPGISKVVEMGIADPSRIAVMGHSHGGYSVLSLIVQTRRFAAAVEIDGYGDLLGSYGEMDAAGSVYGTAIEEHGPDQMGGTPWQFRDRYIENSPFFFLDKVTTPLLIVQGDSDRFVQPFLADQLFVALRRLGREVEYANYRGEGHDPSVWNYVDQVDLSYRIIEWLDHHLSR